MPLPLITPLPTPPSRGDSPSNFNQAADSFLGAFPTFRSELEAWRVALPSVITGTDFSGTSSTSVAIGTGSKSFTIETGKQFQIGQQIRVASTASPANFMDGQVTSYNSGTGALVVNVTAIGGTGTLAAWTVSLAASGAGSFVTPTGTDTLTNKTLTTPVLSGTASGTIAGRLGYNSGALSFGDGTVQRIVASLDGTQTLTNKTFSLASNTLGGTLAQFNAALSGDDFVSLTGTETLTNKTLTAPTINGGTITGAALAGSAIQAGCTVNDTGTVAAASPGFRGLPLSAQTQGAAITLGLTDAGKSVQNTAGGWAIPANASVAFPIGTVIELFNNSGSAQSVSITTDTLRLSGTGTTGTRTIPQYGSAAIVKRAATMWTIAGAVT